MMAREMLRDNFIAKIKQCFNIDNKHCEFYTVCTLVEYGGCKNIRISNSGKQVIVENLVAIDLDNSFPTIDEELYLI